MEKTVIYLEIRIRFGLYAYKLLLLFFTHINTHKALRNYDLRNFDLRVLWAIT